MGARKRVRSQREMRPEHNRTRSLQDSDLDGDLLQVSSAL